MTRKFELLIFMFFSLMFTADIAAGQPSAQSLTQAQASHFAALALKCIQKEYPNKPDHTINDAADVRSPRDMHPTFYGCLDWHSTVHGHWMLVHLLRLFPDLAEAKQIRAALEANLSEKNIAGEVAYLKQPSRASFERTYGWAWLLKLAEELRGWNDEDGRRWSKNLQTELPDQDRRASEHRIWTSVRARLRARGGRQEIGIADCRAQPDLLRRRC